MNNTFLNILRTEAIQNEDIFIIEDAMRTLVDGDFLPKFLPFNTNILSVKNIFCRYRAVDGSFIDCGFAEMHEVADSNLEQTDNGQDFRINIVQYAILPEMFKSENLCEVCYTWVIYCNPEYGNLELKLLNERVRANPLPLDILMPEPGAPAPDITEYTEFLYLLDDGLTEIKISGSAYKDYKKAKKIYDFLKLGPKKWYKVRNLLNLQLLCLEILEICDPIFSLKDSPKYELLGGPFDSEDECYAWEPPTPPPSGEPPSTDEPDLPTPTPSWSNFI